MADGIKIELTEDERETLLHLLHQFINPRVWEATRGARREALEHAGRRALRLAQLEDLAAEDVLRGDIEAHVTDLTVWALETADTTKEHGDVIIEIEQEDIPQTEREARIARMRETTAVDYAHRCVCERIAGQIDRARQAAA